MIVRNRAICQVAVHDVKYETHFVVGVVEGAISPQRETGSMCWRSASASGSLQAALLRHTAAFA